mmetsp:Transcript_31985/g.63435  ORF Transcript_31985/g.63435 Transcript_31985/m.63435 type:complete len:313 (-) Transcript_31985:30-968(-)
MELPLFLESLANDRLMANPPTNVETEKTYLSLMMEGRDVCYNNPTVYCEDLPLGGRGNVASWFLSPRRHAVELVIVVSVWSLVLFLVSLLPKARSFTKRRGKDTKPTAIVSFTALANVLILVAYKWFSSTVGQMYYIVMPCNMQWFMHLTIAFLPMPTRFRDAMMQLMMCYQALVWTVFFTGDTRGLNLPLEVTWFWLNHAILVLYPFYYIASSKTNVMLGGASFVGELTYQCMMILKACAIFAIFYFAIVTPLCFVSLLNLNYMTSPCPGTPFQTENYRIQSQGLFVVFFSIGRIVAVLFEVVLRRRYKTL